MHRGRHRIAAARSCCVPSSSRNSRYNGGASFSGEPLQLQDAQKHPRVAATCRRKGIGSLIMVPIFRNREAAGAVELLFQETRSFSTGDVMDLELIAGVVSDALNVAAQIELKPAEGG